MSGKLLTSVSAFVLGASDHVAILRMLNEHGFCAFEVLIQKHAQAAWTTKTVGFLMLYELLWRQPLLCLVANRPVFLFRTLTAGSRNETYHSQVRRSLVGE